MSKSKQAHILAKKWSRYLLVQALYEWQVTKNDLSAVIEHFSYSEHFGNSDSEYFFEAIDYIVKNTAELNDQLAPYIDRDISMIDPVERAILWLGTYELKMRSELPYKVAINEALELAKKFGAEGSHRYINGVLDKISLSMRVNKE